MPTLRGRRALLFCALGVAAAGCSSPSYRFIDNSKAQTFFKVPRSWTIFDITKPSQSDRPATTSTSTAPWIKVIDGDPQPKVSHVDADYPSSPVVRAEVVSLSRTQFHDDVSISNLRAVATDFKLDPITAYNNGDQSIEIVSYKELATKTGVHGVHLVFNWKKDGSHWLSIDNTAMVDAKTNTLYLLLIRCDSMCFKQNRTTISAIAASWQVRA